MTDTRSSTLNDAAIAAVLSQQSQSSETSEFTGTTGQLSGSSVSPVVRGLEIPASVGGPGGAVGPYREVTCPGGCGLRSFGASPARTVQCNLCGRRLGRGEGVSSCTACNFDVCDPCWGRGGATRGEGPEPRTEASSPSLPFGLGPSRQPHMCEVACIVGEDICMEMMVDSGAQSSVMSSSLAEQLGLTSRIDRREQGIATGVGRARISGCIRDVGCTMGNVEFYMDFIVVEVPEKLLLLGLDQLRRFKCVIDLDKEVLVFGGRDGVEVPMLPPSKEKIDYRSVMNDQCKVM